MAFAFDNTLYNLAGLVYFGGSCPRRPGGLAMVFYIFAGSRLNRNGSHIFMVLFLMVN